MITQWEIISSIHPKTSAICYSLVLDGTEHDARLVAKKLEGYVQSIHPAESPYIYNFQLPQDLDEDTLEKIRVAVREGIEQAKKVNEFVPGGVLGNPLFQADIDKEDKNFPTFVTNDPTQSFFKSDKNISSGDFFSAAPIDPDISEKPAKEQSSFSPQQPAVCVSPAETPHVVSPEELDLHMQVQSVQAPELPQQVADQVIQTPTHPVTEKFLNAFPSETPVPNNTLADASQPLDDILLAATRYDMFMDLNKLDKPAVTSPSSATDTPINTGADKSATPFNIFDQQLKEQTCFMDLEDINDVTERITEKDLAFAQHAAVSEDMKKEITQPALSSPAPSPISRYAQNNPQDATKVMDPFEQLLAAAPVEDSSASPNTSVTPSAGKKPDIPADKSALRSSEPTASKSSGLSAPARQNTPTQLTDLASARQDRVMKKQMPSTEKKIMQEQNDKKPFFHLKRKEQPPQMPAAPKPPIPPAPAAPQIPQPPAGQTPRWNLRPTLQRKQQPMLNTLEKTMTIDHSIQMPLSELKKHNWPLEVPLIPTYTLEKMTISINRFAHATAISVIDNPGKLYNPLVLHGSGGTGKTYFLHAIGYELSKKFGQENIFITNGVRLSRGIQRYIMEGNIDKFEKFTSSVKALLIDDIHLISINEQNREHLSKLLNDFRAQNKQIVITSKYPPENLAKLEELLKFKLDSGWISDLKQASGPARTRIIQQMLTNNNIEISNEDVNRFFGHSNMSLGTVGRSIRRVRVLEKLIFPDMPQEQRSALMILDQLLATKGEDQTSLISQRSPNDIHTAPIVGNGEWGRIGFFYPQHHSNMMNWLVFALQQRAKELGIAGGPELAVRSSYPTENIISSAFKIANLCDNKKLKGAVILGPSLDVCEPSVRENFYDILTHMLEIMMIRCGVINFEDANSPSTYVKTLSELLR